MAKAVKKRGPGRPKSEDPRDIQLTFKVTEDEMASIQAAAQADDRSMSNWIRRTILSAAAESREQKP